MLVLDGTTLAALATKPCGLAQLIELELPVPWYLNTTSWDIDYAGNTYLGTRGVGRIDVIEDTPGEIKGLRFELPAIIDADLATALVGMPQGAAASIYTAVFVQAASGASIVYRKLEWAGRLDVPAIAESDQGSVIQVTAEHMGIDLLRPSGLLYSNADQQRLHSGDRSFEYVIDQSEKAIVWPAAGYFKQ
jgi:hypothetical protein